MFNIVFFEPEIPPNTGNVIRLCSVTGNSLHLIKPLGFSLGEKQLRRAGLDYHEYCDVRVYENWREFLESYASARIFAVSTKGETRFTDIDYREEDCFLFGPETRGLPDEIRQSPAIEDVLKIPMLPDRRSLNLANSAAVIVYEAWRQLQFRGA